MRNVMNFDEVTIELQFRKKVVEKLCKAKLNQANGKRFAKQ